MDRQQARIRAEQWIGAWNERNLDAIMEHYTPSVRFSAPTVISRWKKADGILMGTDALRQHFKRGLERAPNLHFELVDVLMGVDGMTIVYRRETGALVVDVVLLNEDYQGVEVRVYYGDAP